MLRTNSSIGNLSHQQSSSSLLQALVNQRPKSSQKSSSLKRQPSTKKVPNNYKLVTSSLCSPLPARIEQIQPNQRTNETLKPTEPQPPQTSTRNLELSEKKSTKKPSIIQRALFGQSAASLGIKQKTVKLTKDSRSSSKQLGLVQEEVLVCDTENSEMNQKLDQLLNKYKNTTYFKSDPLVEQDQNIQVTKSVQFSTQYSSQKQPEQPEQPKQPITTNTSQINKYVTRVSKGASVIPVQKQPRKRMNSPLHNNRRQTKENTETLFSHRDKKLARNNSTDKRLSSAGPLQKLVGPTLPFPEFEYYMTLARYFNKDKKQEQAIKSLYNNSLKTIQYFSELYQDHIGQSYHALQFCKEATKPTMEELQKKIINLPTNKFQKSIVFDLDETLIHCQESNDDPSDVVLSIKFPTGETVEAGINIRPYCREMLQRLSQKYEIIVFTASHECYAQKVLNYIDPKKEWIHHRFFRDSCVIIQDGLHIKDLRIIGNRNINDMVLIDNASYSFCFQLDNGIPVIPFYDNPLDKELIYLTTYLLELMQSNDLGAKNTAFFKNQLYTIEKSLEGLTTKI